MLIQYSFVGDGQRREVERTALAIGRLDGIAASPDADALVTLLVHREAAWSTSFDGARPQVAELFALENDRLGSASESGAGGGVRLAAAIRYGFDRVARARRFEQSMLREVHAALAGPSDSVRDDAPLRELERFIAVDSASLASLVRAAVAHAMFDAGAPFGAGNGPIGRMLVLLVLGADRAISAPVLCPSVALRLARDQYRDLLDRVRNGDDWEPWIAFLLERLRAAAEDGMAVAKAMRELWARDQARVRTMGRGADSAMALFELLKTRPVLSIPRGARLLGVSRPTTADAFGRLAAAGIVREMTGRRRDRLFAYDSSLALADG